MEIAFDARDRRVSAAAYAALARLVDEHRFLEKLESRVHEETVDPGLIEALASYPSRATVELGRQALVRSMLAESLRAVLCQQLLRRVDQGGRRVLACEILINNDATANLIRKDKAFQLPSVMQTSNETGMRLMDRDLERLVREGVVDPDDALLRAIDKPAFAALLEALKSGAPAPITNPPPTTLPPMTKPPAAPTVPPATRSGALGRPQTEPD